MPQSHPRRFSLPALRGGFFAAALVSAALATGCTAAPTEPSDDGEDSADSESAVAGGTVAAAVTNTCGTVSVKGLSKQIIAEARCMDSSAYAAVPDLGNVSFGSGVFAYLEKPARDKLVSALKSKSSHMSVNSMLRTVAQQYLLYRWYQTGRCGIGLAAKPGNSNHETGLAIDVSQYSTWKGTLQAHGFHWLGSSDPVHFDYAGAGAKSYKGMDVKAFQRLWNRNHPGDKIDTDGVWGPQTEARMKKAPAAGFAKGATCGGSQSYEADAELLLADDSDQGLGDDAALALADAVESHVSETFVVDDFNADDVAILKDVAGASVDANEAHAHGEGDTTRVDDACGTCFYAICEADAYCCETEWDDSCVATGMKICESLCGAEAMGRP